MYYQNTAHAGGQYTHYSQTQSVGGFHKYFDGHGELQNWIPKWFHFNSRSIAQFICLQWAVLHWNRISSLSHRQCITVTHCIQKGELRCIPFIYDFLFLTRVVVRWFPELDHEVIPKFPNVENIVLDSRNEEYTPRACSGFNRKFQLQIETDIGPSDDSYQNWLDSVRFCSETSPNLRSWLMC